MQRELPWALVAQGKAAQSCCYITIGDSAPVLLWSDGFGGLSRNRMRAPFLRAEMERLLTLVEARLDPITRSDEQVNWGDIAARLGNRTAKQCRCVLRWRVGPTGLVSSTVSRCIDDRSALRNHQCH